ncbi:hypothetical protein IEQ34_016815 [Dendrobium chrysotoxum]|uniref:Uncharacterized protein n=1 Tax=Dendrobium chrysotoxum TaxID=161865 RepID=A0AAV7GEH0_DENCH|nr:hypothetical protein IEQ34_016815 [Dendrobium chrysotoxum]
MGILVRSSSFKFSVISRQESQKNQCLVENITGILSQTVSCQWGRGTCPLTDDFAAKWHRIPSPMMLSLIPIGVIDFHIDSPRPKVLVASCLPHLPLSTVSLIPYDPHNPDVSVLWTESKDLGDGFRCIRMVNNILLNFDAFNGDEEHGGVHDGTIIVLWEWLKGKNQRWKIVPYFK